MKRITQCLLILNTTFFLSSCSTVYYVKVGKPATEPAFFDVFPGNTLPMVLLYSAGLCEGEKDTPCHQLIEQDEELKRIEYKDNYVIKLKEGMPYERAEKLLGRPESTKMVDDILEASYFREHLILKFKDNRLNNFLGRDRVGKDILAIDAYTVEMPFLFSRPKVKTK